MTALRDAIDTTALGWVKPELDGTLRQARIDIEAYAESPGDGAAMRACADALHQVEGTLRMLELDAPALMAAEMERLAQALLAGGLPDRDAACAALMRGVVLLPDYLERLQGGHKDIPIVLLPLVNELRAARGEAALGEHVLLGMGDQAPVSEAELEHARGSVSGRNRALLDTVSGAIKEDLLQVKDVLDLHLRSGQRDVSALRPQVETLGRVAETLGMVGLDEARGGVQRQRDALRAMIEGADAGEPATGAQASDEGALLDIAGALLHVDASLDDEVAQLGSPGAAGDGAAAESRRVTGALVTEALANFSAAREAFVAFVETNWDHARLAEVPRLLHEVAGALRILDLPEPADYLEGVRGYTRTELLARGRVPNGRQLDTLADALASVEYYLESMRDRQGGRADILSIARGSLESLGYWPLPPSEPEPDAAGTGHEADEDRAGPGASAPPPSATVTADIEAILGVVAATPVATPAAAPVAAVPVAGGFEATGDEIDDDIREVFLEEFEEEIGNLDQLLPEWRSAPDELDRLRPIRRVFHTLKGSGRLVGARTLGEFSWKIEGMLNRVLDGSRPASPAVIALVDQAFDALPQLHAALRGEGVIQADLAAMQAVADRVAAGEEATYSASSGSAPDAGAGPGTPEHAVPAAPPAGDAGIPAPVDAVLLEILEAEIAGHLTTIDRWVAQAQASPYADDALLRALHTTNGAFAMTEVPAITDAVSPAEGYVKRMLASQAEVPPEGVAALAELADAVRATVMALRGPDPRVRAYPELAARLSALRDALPDVAFPPLRPDPANDDTDAFPQIGAPDAIEPFEDAAAAAATAALETELLERERLAFEAAEAERLEAERLEAERLEAERLEAERVEAERLEAERVEAERVEAERLEAERLEAERVEAERLEAERLEAERVEAERVEAERVEAERLEAERVEAERLEAERLEAERLEAERLEAERLEAERVEAERLEAERLAAEQAAAQRTEAERLEFERLAAEQAEAARLEAERLAEEAEYARLEAEYAEQARLAAEQAETERLAAERAAEERAQAERLAAEQAEAERLAAERAEAERVEAECLAAERAEAERLEAERLEAERLAAEHAEAERLENERAEAERLAAERAEAERAEAARVEAQRLEAERLAAERAESERRKAEAAAAALLATITASADDPDEALDLTGLDPELVDIFVEESRDLLDHSDGLLAALRAAPDEREPLVGLQRDLHTVKGGARMAGIMPIGELGHAMESLLEAVVDQRSELGRDGIPLLERGFDRLHAMVVRVGARRAIDLPRSLIAEFDARARGGARPGLPAAPEVELKPLSAPIGDLAGDDDIGVRAPQEQVRIRADLLDRLVNYAGEVAIYRARLEQQLGAFRSAMNEMEQTNARLRDQLRRLDSETEAQIIARFQRESDTADAAFDPLELDRFSTLQQLSRGLAESAADMGSLQGTLDELTRQYETLLLQQSRVSSDLQEGLMRTRMVPFDALVPRLRRVVRQAATDTGKQVQLKLEGAQGELDRNVLERMTAPLEHMLRNAVAHGIESPDARRRANKPEEGSVRIAVRREGSEVVLEIGDDGAGLDRAAIRRRAEERGLVRADATLGDADLDTLILEPGFSTADEVSRLAGRGTGMDVVASEVRQLGGSLDIASRQGEGSAFTMRLPQTLAVTQAVFVRIGETSFAVPIASVRGVGRISREELDAAGAYRYGGEHYALHDLGTLLGQAPARAEGQLQMPLLLVRSGDLRAAVTIDQVVGNREIVVKPVGPQVASIPGIFGATIMGDGGVVVILDVAPLVRRHAALPRDAAPAPAAERRHVPLVMVVDDSITMRKVTGRVLERHNFEVVAAKDGIDALERMDERVPDLMLLDIEMPRMDGYELATQMRADPRLRDVPIIMITSRTGEKHRERAFEIGVQRYLGKPYQEPELLRNVFELLALERAQGRAGG